MRSALEISCAAARSLQRPNRHCQPPPHSLSQPVPPDIPMTRARHAQLPGIASLAGPYSIASLWTRSTRRATPHLRASSDGGFSFSSLPRHRFARRSDSMASLFYSLHPSCHRSGIRSFRRAILFLCRPRFARRFYRRRLFVLLAPPVVPQRTHSLVRPGGFFFVFRSPSSPDVPSRVSA
jgi:hypothetical protein